MSSLLNDIIWNWEKRPFYRWWCALSSLGGGLLSPCSLFRILFWTRNKLCFEHNAVLPWVAAFPLHLLSSLVASGNGGTLLQMGRARTECSSTMAPDQLAFLGRESQKHRVRCGHPHVYIVPVPWHQTVQVLWWRTEIAMQGMRYWRCSQCQDPAQRYNGACRGGGVQGGCIVPHSGGHSVHVYVHGMASRERLPRRPNYAVQACIYIYQGVESRRAIAALCVRYLMQWEHGSEGEG